LVDAVILSGAADTEHHEISVYEGLITKAEAMATRTSSPLPRRTWSRSSTRWRSSRLRGSSRRNSKGRQPKRRGVAGMSPPSLSAPAVGGSAYQRRRTADVALSLEYVAVLGSVDCVDNSLSRSLRVS
jgi:hypothetical protein